jgi:sugar lactone lactonase YvrE
MKNLFYSSVCFLIVIQFSCQNKPVSPVILEEVASSKKLWTGVAVSQENRIFVNYPRWSPDVDVSVAEVISEDSVIPYPDDTWNSWTTESPPGNIFVCVQSVYIDKNNNLWILDPANPYFQGVVSGGAKLLKVDLTTDQVVQTYTFDENVAPKESYLNDIRIDTDRNIGYLTDSGLGGIIVIDLSTGKSRRLIDDHGSTKAEDISLTIEGKPFNFIVHSDGLALDPENVYLYYQALTGRNLYRIKTEYLRNADLSAQELAGKVEWVTESGASDAIEFDNAGNLYFTSIELNAIRKYTPQGKLEVVVQDDMLKWPDSFSITADGTIYLTTSQLHLGNNPPDPYKIFKITQ